MAFRSSSNALFIFLIVANLRPFMGRYSFGNKKKRVGTISWCKIVLIVSQFRAFFSFRFLTTAHNIKVVLLIELTIFSQESLPLQSKKTVSKTFTFDQTWRAFFGLTSSAVSIEMIEPKFCHQLWSFWTTLTPFSISWAMFMQQSFGPTCINFRTNDCHMFHVQNLPESTDIPQQVL